MYVLFFLENRALGYGNELHLGCEMRQRILFKVPEYGDSAQELYGLDRLHFG